MKHKLEISIIILSGGKSSRMGVDKGLVLLNGKPMIKHVIDVAKMFTQNIIISANKNEYDSFGFPVVEDEIKNIGPMGGVYTCLKQSKTDKNIILTCDSPLVNRNILVKLLEKTTQKMDVIYFKHKTYTYPLTAVYDKRTIPEIEKLIYSKSYRMRTLFKFVTCFALVLSDDEVKLLTNINNRKELNQLQ